MNLVTRARINYCKSERRLLGISRAIRLSNSGMYNGEWTCAICGTMIGRNLCGDSPLPLVFRHINMHHGDSYDE